MKKSLLFLILLVFSKLLIGQFAIQDAIYLRQFVSKNASGRLVLNHEEFKNSYEIKLKSLKDTAEKHKRNDEALKLDDSLTIYNQLQLDTIISIMGLYFDYKSENDKKKVVSKNPFFNEISFPGDFKESDTRKQILLSRIVGEAGGVDVTSFANAISELMIERAKEELTVSFFNRFRDFSKENQEFKVLFPKTTGNLENLLTYAYPQMLPALRNSFHEDINQLAYHLDDVLELPRYEDLLKNFPEVRVAIRSIRLIHQLENGSSNAADLIKEFADLEDWKDSTASIAFKNVANSTALAKLFSESLRNKIRPADSSLWIEPKDLKQFIKDDILVRIYLGLLYEQCRKENIVFYLGTTTPKPFTSILAENKNSVFLFQTKVAEFISLANKVNFSFKDLKQKHKSNKKITNEDIYNYVSVSIDAMDYAFGIITVFKPELATEEYVVIVRKSNELYRDIYKEQYTQAVKDAIDIVSKVQSLVSQRTSLEEEDRSLVTSLTKLQSDLNTAPTAEKMNRFVSDSLKSKVVKTKLSVLTSAKKNLDHLKEFAEKVEPYGLFIANVAQAKSEDDIKAAIENVILPVGSSSIKKNAKFNISVQSYLGGRWTAASAKNKDKGLSTWNSNFGVTAPIGFALSWGFKKYGSLSLFLPLVDLGAVVDYKLTTSGTDSTGKPITTPTGDYQVKLGQLFAPGAYLSYGFGGNWPLTLGVGTQYGPGLENLKGAASVSNSYWSARVFLAVDIPFFTLYNNRKTSKN